MTFFSDTTKVYDGYKNQTAVDLRDESVREATTKRLCCLSVLFAVLLRCGTSVRAPSLAFASQNQESCV